MTNETEIDTNAVTYVETRAFDLKEKRKAWEEGTYIVVNISLCGADVLVTCESLYHADIYSFARKFTSFLNGQYASAQFAHFGAFPIQL